MPVENNFQHARYSRSNPGDRVSYPIFQEGDSFGSEGWLMKMGQSAKHLEKSGVRGVLFLGGFPFIDLFGVGRLDEVGGLKRGYSRGIPGMESLLTLLRPTSNGIVRDDEKLTPPLGSDQETLEEVDRIADDVGNFSSESVAAFQRAVDEHGGGHIHIDRYMWTSVNHHLGRVKAALNLIEFLAAWTKNISLAPDERVLLQAYGHAGQLLSLISNLINPEESLNRQILFQVLANHHERTRDPEVTSDRLENVYHMVTEPSFLGGTTLDIVTYGTPIRGGWDTTGIGHLLHFVNHRPLRGDGKPWLAKMELPQIAWEIPMISGGDYVQQLSVAGSDCALDSTQDELVNQELREILEPYDGFERWLECVRRGTRCQNDGKCLLVDYQVNAEGSPRSHLFGHGCYSQKRSMLFNTSQIVEHLY